jgi:hypothetical protein
MRLQTNCKKGRQKDLFVNSLGSILCSALLRKLHIYQLYEYSANGLAYSIPKL